MLCPDATGLLGAAPLRSGSTLPAFQPPSQTGHFSGVLVLSRAWTANSGDPESTTGISPYSSAQPFPKEPVLSSGLSSSTCSTIHILGCQRPASVRPGSVQ